MRDWIALLRIVQAPFAQGHLSFSAQRYLLVSWTLSFGHFFTMKFLGGAKMTHH
jgi:hypothetical protein